MDRSCRVAVVGAGVAGLVCARALLEHDVDVVVFDKGRAPGGRLSSRRTAELAVIERRGATFLLRGTVAPVGTTLGPRDASKDEEPLSDLGAFDAIVLCLPPAQAHALLDDFARVLGIGPVRATASTLQRWAFARASSPLAHPLFDDEARIGVGGDWTAGGRVEGAFLSGAALAGRVLDLPDTA